ncbi:hypothetical protein BpHYR1_019366 [Brachionus plicatilis]|uniref:Uncharacterized protein n=1 Tax=Brachionus plicatilis TaxID=10195 RepID=A0A3M7PXS1_BRAPC|nr:hypothetical protein BpHYR1_019366 [Brachionus plicatilis]
MLCKKCIDKRMWFCTKLHHL